MQIQITAIASVAVISALAMAAGHYIARHFFPGPQPGREWGFPRIIAYTYGVLAISVPVTVFWIERGWLEGALALWAAIGAGGFSTAACYWVDDWWKTRMDLRDAQERKKLQDEHTKRREEMARKGRHDPTER